MASRRVSGVITAMNVIISLVTNRRLMANKSSMPKVNSVADSSTEANKASISGMYSPKCHAAK